MMRMGHCLPFSWKHGKPQEIVTIVSDRHDLHMHGSNCDAGPYSKLRQWVPNFRLKTHPSVNEQALILDSGQHCAISMSAYPPHSVTVDDNYRPEWASLPNIIQMLIDAWKAMQRRMFGGMQVVVFD
ncbi:hypothetical protein VNO77_03221 [Canavalia gladiata]|uniref:Uncharacterized protein n=1 Tax=Canavalia gladiata TaxID=3824 RepID=A0AAN9R3M9_CANGL